MRQEDIMRLLQEASQIGLEAAKLKGEGQLGSDRRVEISDRISQIQRELGDAQFKHGYMETDVFSDNLLQGLLIDTFENRPDQLPALFPFFANYCGDRRPCFYS